METQDRNSSRQSCRCKRQSKLRGKIAIFENPAGGPFDEKLDYFIGTKGGGGVLIASGTTTWQVDSRYHTITGSGLILMSKGMFTNLKFSNDFEGYLFWMSEEFMSSLTIDVSKSELLQNLTTSPHIKSLDSNDIYSVSSFLKLLAITIDEDESNRQIDVVKMLVKALFYKTISKVTEFETDESFTNHKDQISKDFLILTRKYGHQHRDLSFYADKMCVTPKYLSSAISKSSGKRAHLWLEQATMNKAKYLLKETDKPIYLISDELNFGSPADFVRYFRTRENATPLAYRRMSLD